MYIPAFIVTSADISQLWVYLCYLLIYCLRLFVQTCNVYGAWVTLYCICSWSLVLTSASYIGTFSLFINVLPEAICCCLQTCYVVSYVSSIKGRRRR